MGIVFATPAALITKALKDIGVVGFGRNATAIEIVDGLETLNLLLDELGVLRENIAVRTSESFPFTVGKSQYTIGVGGDFNTVRPVRIEQAYYRDVNNTDFQLDCGMIEDDYTGIPIKNIVGNPQGLYYKPSYPLGLISFDYAPSVAWTLFLLTWKPFTKITDANDATQLSFPDGCEAALVPNLSKMLCSPNKKQCPPEVAERAVMALQAFQAAYGETKSVINWGIPGTKTKRASFFDMGAGE